MAKILDFMDHEFILTLNFRIQISDFAVFGGFDDIYGLLDFSEKSFPDIL